MKDIRIRQTRRQFLRDSPIAASLQLWGALSLSPVWFDKCYREFCSNKCCNPQAEAMPPMPRAGKKLRFSSPTLHVARSFESTGQSSGAGATNRDGLHRNQLMLHLGVSLGSEDVDIARTLRDSQLLRLLFVQPAMLKHDVAGCEAVERACHDNVLSLVDQGLR